MLWGCANLTVSSNSHGVVYVICLSGQSYLSTGKRSVNSGSGKRMRGQRGGGGASRNVWTQYRMLITLHGSCGSYLLLFIPSEDDFFRNMGVCVILR